MQGVMRKQETLLGFLRETVQIPGCGNHFVQPVTFVTDMLPNRAVTGVFSGSHSQPPVSRPSPLDRRSEALDILQTQNKSLKRKLTTVSKELCDEKKMIAESQRRLSDLSDQNKVTKNELKKANSLVGTKVRDLRDDLLNKEQQTSTLKKVNSALQTKVKALKEVSLRSKKQERDISELNARVKLLTETNVDSLEQIATVEREKNKTVAQLTEKRKELRKMKKQVDRHEEATEKYKDKICEMLQRHNTTVAGLNAELEKLKNLETYSGGHYLSEVRLMYYDLLTKGVSCNIIQDVVKCVLDHASSYNINSIKLPSRSTAQRMVAEAGYLAKVRASYEMARNPHGVVGHQSDGTTKQLIHWGAHAVRLVDNDTSESMFTLTISPVSSGTAEDTVLQLEQQFHELQDLADSLSFEKDEDTFTLGRIGTRMSDRAATEKKVSKLLIERKRQLLENKDMTDEEKAQLSNVFSFTCANHKVNNTAAAMTSHSAKELYQRDTESTWSSRGMQGAVKHIYEVNKLLCERSRKEYSLGADFKAYTLSAGVDKEAGASLFRPIVGNRYLIFLQNAIPTLCCKEIVMLYLEDVRDGKDTVGLNRLELSVQRGYLDVTVESETVAFAVMYHRVCAPLLAKAKSASSPLELNQYYLNAIEALGLWRSDATSLLQGTEEMWPGSPGCSDVMADYMSRVQQMGDSDLVQKILQGIANAGMEKLACHAEEHLPGGIYYDPTPEMETAATTLGEATNDKIESLFGMLDRQLNIAPSSNPLNVGSLIAAKVDKVVEWARNHIPETQMEKVGAVVRKFASKQRKTAGTRVDQLKRLYLIRKAKKDKLIKKRRDLRLAREALVQERLNRLPGELVRSRVKVKEMSGKGVNDQINLWKALNTRTKIKRVDLLKNLSAKNVSDRKKILCQIVKFNKQLNTEEVCSGDESDDGFCTSDEETLDTLRIKK